MVLNVYKRVGKVYIPNEKSFHVVAIFNAFIFNYTMNLVGFGISLLPLSSFLSNYGTLPLPLSVMYNVQLHLLYEFMCSVTSKYCSIYPTEIYSSKLPHSFDSLTLCAYI